MNQHELTSPLADHVSFSVTSTTVYSWLYIRCAKDSKRRHQPSGRLLRSTTRQRHIRM